MTCGASPSISSLLISWITWFLSSTEWRHHRATQIQLALSKASQVFHRVSEHLPPPCGTDGELQLSNITLQHHRQWTAPHCACSGRRGKDTSLRLRWSTGTNLCQSQYKIYRYFNVYLSESCGESKVQTICFVWLVMMNLTYKNMHFIWDICQF